jgi:hypothetical protein
MNNSEIEARLKFLEIISLLQSKLYRPGIESQFLDPDQKKKFKFFRLNWTLYVETVQIDILSVLIDQLELNRSEFEAGIEDINAKIQEIDDAVSFLARLERGLMILGRIIRLVML